MVAFSTIDSLLGDFGSVARMEGDGDRVLNSFCAGDRVGVEEVEVERGVGVEASWRVVEVTAIFSGGGGGGGRAKEDLLGGDALVVLVFLARMRVSCLRVAGSNLSMKLSGKKKRKKRKKETKERNEKSERHQQSINQSINQSKN